MFKKLLLCTFLLPSVFLLPAADIVRNGKPEAVIVLPEKPTTSAQFAAEELKYHIRKITGVELPVSNAVASGKTAICIGSNSGSFRDQEYAVSVKGDKILLAGDDEKVFQKVDYQDPLTWPNPWKGTGTLYAVYDFLEQLGVRWYLPTDLGCAFTPTRNLSIADISIRRKPSLESRKLNTHILRRFPEALYCDTVPLKQPVPLLNERETLLFYLRQRVGGLQIVVNHSLGSFYKRFKEKRDWFAQGHKLRWDSQLCYTNPEVIAQAVKDARDYFDGKVDARTVMEGHYSVTRLSDPSKDVYAMVPMDHAGYCQCKRCLALTNLHSKAVGEVSDGDRVSNLFFSFVNAVAKEVKKTHPTKTIAVLSYAEYAWPPTNIRLEDNIMVELCLTVRSVQIPSAIESNFKRLREWHKQYPKMKKYVWLYFCWPILTTRNSRGRTFPGYFAGHLQEYWDVFKEVGIQGFFIESSGANGVALPMFDLPEYFINAKLAWNSSVQASTLFDEFFEKFYGPAAPPMKEFYLLAQSVYSNPVNYPENTGIWSTYPVSKFVTAERFKKFDASIKQALSLATMEPFRSRVNLFKNAVWDYLQKDLAEEGTRLPSMQQNRVPYVEVSEPGNPEKADWSKAANLPLYNGLRATGLSGNPISASVMHDGSWIYFRYTEYVNNDQLRKELGIWRDDTWESFFAKQRATPYRLLGVCIDQKADFLDVTNGYRQLPVPGKTVVRELGKNGWQTFLALNLAELVPGGIKPGEILYYNLLRSRDAQCSACYIPTWGQFHVPERFGELYLETHPQGN